MMGTFVVHYRHAETAVLAPRREHAVPYVADARECIRVVVQGPERVVMQHLLLVGEPPLVVKHWCGDWEHTAERRLCTKGRCRMAVVGGCAGAGP